VKIARNVYKRDDIYKGEFLGEASDLQLGFEDGYRVSWQTTLAARRPGIVLRQQEKMERRPRAASTTRRPPGSS
jgi:hypothetical protein